MSFAAALSSGSSQLRRTSKSRYYLGANTAWFCAFSELALSTTSCLQTLLLLQRVINTSADQQARQWCNTGLGDALRI